MSSKIVLAGAVRTAEGKMGGILFGKVFCFVIHGKANPLIGTAIDAGFL